MISLKEEYSTDKPLYCVFFVSRPKDNKNIKQFERRTKEFLTTKNFEDLHQEFGKFVRSGKMGETSRFYASVNSRDNKKVHQATLEYLVQHPELNMAKLPLKIVSIANKPENSLEKKWLLDFDFINELTKQQNQNLLDEFIEDLKSKGVTDFSVSPTPNGAHIIVNNGFDTRGLLTIGPNGEGPKWKIVSLKKDDYKLINYATKTN